MPGGMGSFFDWRSMGSLYATLMFIRTALRELLPPEIYYFLKTHFSRIFNFHSRNTLTIQIEEYDNGNFMNDIYTSIQTYLSSKCFSSSTNVLKLSRLRNSQTLNYNMVPNQTLTDTYEGVKFKWTFLVSSTESSTFRRSSSSYENSTKINRYFEVCFDEKKKEFVHGKYLPYVMRQADEYKFKNRGKLLYTNSTGEGSGHVSAHSSSVWSQVSYFKHPSTFDTIAIDPVLKEEIKGDLEKFISRKDYYTRVGRSWKRGYLLYGPPGTGKTSMIAAIANFLEFDIYDIELTAVKSNSQLRKLLIATTSKSVIVIEDIDCSLDLANRNVKQNVYPCEKKVGMNFQGDTTSTGSSISLSGLLNFVDGLWSSCSGERLIIFTTNHKEKLDPALLRPGRMDKHIHLSFCGYSAFKILVKNYLLIEEHEKMKEVEELIELVKMTPADVAEFLMSCDDNAEVGVTNVVKEVKKRLKLINIEDLNDEMRKKVTLLIKEEQEKEELDGHEEMKQRLLRDDKQEMEKQAEEEENAEDKDYEEVEEEDDSDEDLKALIAEDIAKLLVAEDIPQLLLSIG
ncbi:hypothetical protein MKW92_046708 [Papaver armeniacum]|nr:hypothetical protein MKW92_046708 [Papaver armeniacum]